MDRLCQLTNSLLERSVRQQVLAPVSNSREPFFMNRMRPRYHFQSNHRQRRRARPRTVASTWGQPLPPRQLSPLPSSPPPSPLASSTSTSSRTNSMQPATMPPSISARDHSRESLVSLYWLFQDNLNSSRTPCV